MGGVSRPRSWGMKMDNSAILKQLESAISIGEEVAKRYPHKTFSAGQRNEIEEHQAVTGAITSIAAAIRRLDSRNGEYLRQADALIEKYGNMNSYIVPSMVGIAKTLRRDAEQGHLRTLGELLHGEVFSDFLDMATHLHSHHYKDAAAVIAGGTLEGHLRKLCEKNLIAIQKDNCEPKTLDAMNVELAKAAVYGLTQQKAITSWADIRNKAAHGEYKKFDAAEVQGMIFGIRNFLAAFPA